MKTTINEFPPVAPKAETWPQLWASRDVRNHRIYGVVLLNEDGSAVKIASAPGWDVVKPIGHMWPEFHLNTSRVFSTEAYPEKRRWVRLTSPISITFSP